MKYTSASASEFTAAPEVLSINLKSLLHECSVGYLDSCIDAASLAVTVFLSLAKEMQYVKPLGFTHTQREEFHPILKVADIELLQVLKEQGYDELTFRGFVTFIISLIDIVPKLWRF